MQSIAFSGERHLKVLVTGVAGFIGMHVAQYLLARGDTVVGIDNLSDYYSVRLKQARLQQLARFPDFSFIALDIVDLGGLQALFAREKFDRVVHLAAQAGVRYSIEQPAAYIQSNLVGFNHVLEACRHAQTPHLVYASSSSVYGSHAQMPFSEHASADHPLSLYAATKKSNELMAHAYSHLYGLPTTGLRFFTVYGPWGRPDMSPWLFTKAILEKKPIKLFNHGNMLRDFTYIDDIVAGTVRAMDQVAEPNGAFDVFLPDPATSHAPYRIFNIGNHQPEALMMFVQTLEQALGCEAIKEMWPMQAGDVLATYANIDAIDAAVGFTPNTPLAEGLARWVAWYRDYAHTM